MRALAFILIGLLLMIAAIPFAGAGNDAGCLTSYFGGAWFALWGVLDLAGLAPRHWR